MTHWDWGESPGGTLTVKIPYISRVDPDTKKVHKDNPVTLGLTIAACTVLFMMTLSFLFPIWPLSAALGIIGGALVIAAIVHGCMAPTNNKAKPSKKAARKPAPDASLAEVSPEDRPELHKSAAYTPSAETKRSASEVPVTRAHRVSSDDALLDLGHSVSARSA